MLFIYCFANSVVYVYCVLEDVLWSETQYKLNKSKFSGLMK